MPRGIHMLGRHLSAETKRKISEKLKLIGHKPPIHYPDERSLKNLIKDGSFCKGKKLSEEHKKKISISLSGKSKSERSEIHRKRLSESIKGRKCPWISEHNKKCIGLLSKNWKGGITEKDKLEREKFRREMQKHVYERDNYTCQICGKRGVDLQVDHIQSWSEYVELRFCIDNCRTLCMKCHYEITYGKPMPPEIRAWGHNLFKGGTQL